MKFINTPEAPLPIGAYAQATAHNGTIYVSGQLPITPTGELADGIRAQTRQSLENILAILRSQGANKKSILKVQVFTTNLAAFSDINEEYQVAYLTKSLKRMSVKEQVRLSSLAVQF